MGNDRLVITDVSSRLLAHEIASKYGLWFKFFGLGTPECEGAVLKVSRDYYGSISQYSALDTLSADKFNSMTVQDLEDMCEYWKMVGVFSHG
jgi:hypothetical protein